jgi:hypothetical protein
MHLIGNTTQGTGYKGQRMPACPFFNKGMKADLLEDLRKVKKE